MGLKGYLGKRRMVDLEKRMEKTPEAGDGQMEENALEPEEVGDEIKVWAGGILATDTYCMRGWEL